MKYLLMLCGEEGPMSEAVDKGLLVAGCEDWMDQMVTRNIVEGAFGLRPVSTATTVTSRDGKVLFTDGPFAETKDQLGGLVMIDCADLEEAMEVAAKHPVARYGKIEIRPVWEQ